MSLSTKQEVLDFWAKNENAESRAERREIESLKKDIRTAQALITDAINRYRKKKLNAKSKAAASSADVFAELDDYQSEESIRDAYGWDVITEKEMERLMNLWKLREESNSKSDVYNDRITEMLNYACESVFSKYEEQIWEYNSKISQMHKVAEEVARENYKNDVQKIRDSLR